jgi:WD40 repeat protein
MRVTEVIQETPLNAISWCPHKKGLLATGGGEGDQIIRLWDFVDGPEPDFFVHSLKCSSPITSIAWRKAAVPGDSLCTELVSTHAGPLNEIKLWQTDRTLQSETQYWFTKVKDFVCHDDAIVT